MEAILKQPVWRIIDQSNMGSGFDPKSSFAIDDAICQSVGQGNEPFTARTWVHHNTIILGIQDARLPFLKQGLEFLHKHGYQAIVRNSGGLAVVLDEGVLNISFIMPEKHNNISIDDGYETMTYFVQQMLQSYNQSILAKEIIGSYCPGRYDLSINGKKFAGISQRRIRGGVAVQIYLSITSSGAKRAALVRDFYMIALNNESTRFDYPTIIPSTMASLTELLNQQLTVSDIMQLFYKTIYDYGQIKQGYLSPEETMYYEIHYKRMIDRNEKALG